MILYTISKHLLMWAGWTEYQAGNLAFAMAFLLFILLLDVASQLVNDYRNQTGIFQGKHSVNHKVNHKRKNGPKPPMAA